MNMMKTFFLLLGLTALLTVMGWALDQMLGTGGIMMLIFFGVGIVTNWVSFFFSDSIVLKMYRAKEVSREEAPELHEIVDRISRAAGIPKPKVAIIPNEEPNAFATGRNPSRGVVACTRGIMRALSWDELEGVIAHEIGHIRNRDTLVSTVAATLAGAIGMASYSARYGILFGGGRREGGGNPLMMIIVLILIVLAPIIAMLVQFAISRTREYGADRAGAQFCGKPEALASALEKIESVAKRKPMETNPGTAHMFIINPLSGAKVGALFSTHPPTAERTKRLRQLAKENMTGGTAFDSQQMGVFR